VFKSVLGAAFRNQLAETIFAQKYKHEGAETWEELAYTIVEDVCQQYLTRDERTQLTQYISEMKFLPGGRYVYYAGRAKKFFNSCYIFKSEEDTREDWAYLSWKAERCLTVGGGIGNDYCLAPYTKIMMKDLTWKYIKDLEIGEELIGFDEGLSLQKGILEKSIVTGLGKAKLPCYKIDTDQGSVVASENHQWVYRDKWPAKKKGEGYHWKITKELKVGAQIAFTSKPWTVHNDFDSGWLSGIFDGEGWLTLNGVNKLGLGVCQNEGPVLDKIKELLTEYDIPFSEVASNQSNVKIITPLGRWGKLKTLGMIRPIRLLEKLGDNLFQTKARGKHNTPPATITSIEFLGDKDVITIGTSTKTLIANGFMSHNSIYRPKHSHLKSTGGEASGPISKMRMINEIGREVMQGGSRRSAIYASLNHKHEDINDFLYCKDWFNIKVAGTDTTLGQLKAADFNFPCPLDMTNVSVNYDTEWLMNYWQSHKVSDTFLANCHQAMKTGEPGFSFNFFDKETETGRNACTEISTSDDSDVCNLGSLNFSRITSLSELKDVVELATKFLICGTLRAELPYDKVYKIREKNRRLGLGIMGLHEWLIQRGYKYEMVDELKKWFAVYRSCSRGTADRFSSQLDISNPVACRAIAPTGSIGIIAGTTTGIEPIYAIAIKRRYLKGTTWKYQYVIDGAAKDLIDRYGINPDYLESSIDLAKDYERRIKFQADVQDYVDMSISSTINLPKWDTEYNHEGLVKDFANTLASYAHRLRGFTVYPDGARGGQPLVSVPYHEAIDRIGVELEENTEVFDVCDITGTGFCSA
jgi:ribonucleoside-diphosphate reductase alpha chain